MRKNIALLGATGSIGRNTLDILRFHSDRFRLYAFSYHRNRELAEKIIEEFEPEYVVSTFDQRPIRKKKTKWLFGIEGLKEISAKREVDIVLVATSGITGVFPTIEALKNRKRVALSNKETLVSFGEIIKPLIKEKTDLIPVDSEHSALYQLLENRRGEAEKIYLTASGGPFREYSYEKLKNVTPEEALKHPTWKMGAKITVDSATLMNKGLEVIEAYWLFNFELSKIEVVVHPESIIHGIIELRDGSFLAHLGYPDMRIPIQYALSYPERLKGPVKPLNFAELKALHFEAPDLERFRCLKIAYEVLKTGKEKPAIMNAANETAVYAFLEKKIGFLDIPRIIEKTLEESEKERFGELNLENLLFADRWARETANRFINELDK